MLYFIIILKYLKKLALRRPEGVESLVPDHTLINECLGSSLPIGADQRKVYGD